LKYSLAMRIFQFSFSSKSEALPLSSIFKEGWKNWRNTLKKSASRLDKKGEKN